jgi:hypothetical protein
MDVHVYKDPNGVLHFSVEELAAELVPWEKIGTAELPLNEEEEPEA